MEYLKKEEEYHTTLNNICETLYEVQEEMKGSEFIAVDPFVFIEKRIKSFDSAIRKYRKKCEKIPQNMTELEKEVKDIAGIRIICPCVDDVYVVEKILSLRMKDKNITILPNEKDDYVKCPKDSGYSSLHLTLQSKNLVLVEVQIRSMLMHTWSRIEHNLRYKNPNPKPTTIKVLEYLAKMFRKMDNLLVVIREHGDKDDESVISKAIDDITNINENLESKK